MNMSAEKFGRTVAAVVREIVKPEAMQRGTAAPAKTDVRRSVAVPLTITKLAGAEGKCIFTGVATTREIDRMGDIVEPSGAVYDLPIPLLLQHSHAAVVGWVRDAKVLPDRIEVTCEVAEGATAKCDEAAALVRRGLAVGLSIGFMPIKAEPISTGMRFIRWAWHELSIVTIGANGSAKIASTKSTGSVRLIGAPVRGGIKLISAGGKK